MGEKFKEKRRAYRVFFLNPRFQIKYSLFYTAVAMTGLAIMAGIVVFFLINLVDKASVADPGQSIWEVLLGTIQANYGIVGGLSFVLATALFFFAYVLSKNIVGPAIVLHRHIEELKKGNYEHKTVLRKTDEFKDLMNALNELSITLKQRHSTSHQAAKKSA